MYKYKYKYKYGFMDPEAGDNHRLTSKRNGFISQKTPPPIEGRPDISYKPSIFYTEPNGRGNSFVLYPGQDVPDLKDWPKHMGSVSVGPYNAIYLYQGPNFSGGPYEGYPTRAILNVSEIRMINFGPKESYSSIRVRGR
jgi:hypothetical protein